MRVFIAALSLFIGVLAYNIYTSTEEQIILNEFGTRNIRPDERVYAKTIVSNDRIYGFAVGVLSAGVSLIGLCAGLNSLQEHRRKQ
jgi:hypothetical protein